MKKKLEKFITKFSKKGLNLKDNKRFFAMYSILFTLVILISATLAWSSYSEWVRNHVQSNPETITVKVVEDFEQESILRYEENTQKSVRVKNASKRNAIIRVKFEESFLPFEVDITDGEDKGNGNLRRVVKSNEELIKLNDTSTWKKGALYESGNQDDKGNMLYYIAADKIITNNAYKGEKLRSDSTQPQELSFFKWNFNKALYEAPNLNNDDPYWVFDGRYFYYSKVLSGGTTTDIDLLQSIELAQNFLPNRFKNALYDINVIAEGVEATESGLKHWNKEVEYLDMYKKDSKFK